MIYAIQAVGTEFVKIGITERDLIADRLSALQVGSPHELVLLASADWAIHYERHIHRHLRAHWVRGEWFRLAPGVEAVIATMLASPRDPEPFHALLQAHATKRTRRRLGRILDIRCDAHIRTEA